MAGKGSLYLLEAGFRDGSSASVVGIVPDTERENGVRILGVN